MRKALKAGTLLLAAGAALALAYWCGWQHLGARAKPRPVTTATALSDADLLFLEALRRGYALDDAIVRRQLVRRMQDTLLSEHPPSEPDDAQLSAYLAQHADRYQSAPRYSFDHVYLSRAAQGAGLAASGAALAARLHAAPQRFAGLGDPFPRGQQLQQRDLRQIEADFGYAIAHAVPTLAPGQWQGPLASPLGLHFLRITAVIPARPLTLDEVRVRLRSDDRMQQQQQLLRDALARLRQEFSAAPPLPVLAPMHDEDLP